MKIENVEKPVTNLNDKSEHVIHIRNIKQALNHELVLKKVHRVIKFYQKGWLKPYIDMNTKLRKKAKNDFEILTNNGVFGKSMENVRKYRNIKLVTTERRINYLVLEPNYPTTKFFTENLLVIDMRKSQILMNKPVYLGLSILDLSKIVIYQFWHDYVKQNMVKMQSFVMWIQTGSLFM